MLPRYALSLSFLLVCLLSSGNAASDDKTSAVYDEMFQLLEQKADLETQIKNLNAELSRKRQKLEAGKYELDTEACKKVIKCETAQPQEKTSTQSDHLKSEEEESKEGGILAEKPDRRKAKDARFLGKYSFETKPVPVMDANDPKLEKMLFEGRPVLIKNSGLVGSAIANWNLASSVENIGGSNLSITMSKTRQFLYFKEDLNMGEFVWTPPYETREGVFADFIEMVEQLQAAKNGTHTYFHCPLNAMHQGKGMREDFQNFNWKWLDSLKPEHWKKLRINLLLIGMPNVVTPAHYDMMQNLFAQVRGFKRCFLFEPGSFKNLYIYPTTHPSDRQSQVDFDQPNYDAFPRLRDLSGYEVVVGPGDVLYIPAYWFHYIESESDRMTMSLNFWFGGQTENEEDSDNKEESNKSKERSDDSHEGGLYMDVLPSDDFPPETYLLKQIAELEISRHIESVVFEKLGGRRVGSYLHDYFDKRFGYLQQRPESNETRNNEQQTEMEDDH